MAVDLIVRILFLFSSFLQQAFPRFYDKHNASDVEDAILLFAQMLDSSALGEPNAILYLFS